MATNNVLSNNIILNDNSQINSYKSMTNVEMIDNEIKQIISKRAKKRRPSPTLLSKITGIEIGTAPSKSFRKKSKTSAPEVDSTQIPNVLYDSISEPGPSTWITSRIAYDIDNDDEDVDDAYYPPIIDNSNVYPTNFNEALTEPLAEHSSDKLTDTSNDLVPKSTRLNRFKEIANQWSSILTENITIADSRSKINAERMEYINKYEETSQLNQHHNKFQHNHYNKQNKLRRTRDSSLNNDSLNHFRRHNLRYLNSSIQTDNVITEDCGLQTQTDKDLQASSFNLGSASKYHTSCKDLKGKAVQAKNSMEKILYLFEASINLLLESFALESHTADLVIISKKFNETLNFSKNNGIYISQHLSKEDDNYFWDVLSVLNIQLGAYINNKLYSLRKVEISGAKTTIDNLFLKNDKSPSLYSPNISNEINEETKLREKICSEKLLPRVQFYVTHMEHLAKWRSYLDRADVILQQNNKVTSFFERLTLLVGTTRCDEDIHIFFNYINQAYQQIKNKTL